MSKKPKVSIIIPVYNAEKYLKQCLDSVSNQTFNEIEIICVDDGSNDNSLNILKEYAQKDLRFTIIEQKNLYAGVARNNALKIAMGEYIMFLDADDWCELNMVEDIYNETISKNTDISVFQFYNFDENKQAISGKIQGFRVSIEQQYFEKPFTCEETEGKIFSWLNFGPCNKIFKTKFINDNNLTFQNTRVSNDVKFFFEAFSKAGSISLLNKALSYYRINTGVSLCDNKWKYLDYRIEALKAAEEKIKKLSYFDKVKYSFKNQEIGSYIGFINAYLQKNLSEHYKNLQIYLNSIDENLYSDEEFKKYFWYEDYTRIKTQTYENYTLLKKS